jgi:hypothetical protein
MQSSPHEVFWGEWKTAQRKGREVAEKVEAEKEEGRWKDRTTFFGSLPDLSM